MFQNAEIWFQAKLQKRCCHLCGDRSCFSCGRSKTLSSALKTQGALPTLELLRAEFLCQVLLMRADIAGASRLALTVLQQHHPTLTGKGKRMQKADALSYLYHRRSMSIPPTTAVRIMVLQFTNCYLESSHGFVNLCN